MSDAPAPDLVLEHRPAWVPAEEAERCFEALLRETPWRREHIRLFGREVAIPRRTAWVGDPGRAYAYSGLTMRPLPWTPLLTSLRSRVEEACGVSFNGVLLNLYRDGGDSMGWHADDEPELGPAPTLASLSLGATRAFQLKHRSRKDVARVDLDLADGDLLIMRPPTQAHWLHQVPKRRGRNAPGARINLTFRRVCAPTAVAD